ncbi:unnamed protein product [Adineta steineri]|uniref:ADP ribosyltransferase domain-containing protein n=1 Tax=Adineta steineri TaxID=433720 RepID=A0A814Y9I1_9BILA|nr:unnamed protein product [Adineta steineri]CAF1517751.1 unnamed protein product [Adineta steineri]
MEIITFYDEHQQGTRDLSEQSAEFLWFQLFKDVIQQLPRCDDAKQEMLTVCREYYRNNLRILGDVNNFDMNYDEDTCIWWYTKETFVYRLINKALRTEDIEQLYLFRYYIADLSRQLAKEHEKIKNQKDETLYLYRGTKIHRKELTKVKANVNKLIAINGYWSTSRDRSYACTFANKMTNRVDHVPVLYEIKCNLKDPNGSIIVADISDLSELSLEKECLFDAGSIFYIENIKEENEGDTELIVEYTQALTYQLNGLEVRKECLGLDNVVLAFSYEEIANIYSRQKIYGQALQYHLQALELRQKDLPAVHRNTAWSLYQVGKMYYNIDNLTEAIQHNIQALEMTKSCPSYNGQQRTVLSILEDLILLHKNRSEKVLTYQLQVLDIHRNTNPIDYSKLTGILIDISSTCRALNKIKDSLDYYKEGLTIQIQEQLADKLILARKFHCLASEYEYIRDINCALECYQNVMNINTTHYPRNHWLCEKTQRNINRLKRYR